MKRQGILNSEISRVLTYMGHTDQICIGDCGLPIPEETERIDLALRFGQPSFMEVLKEVAEDMKIRQLFALFETGCETGFKKELQKEQTVEIVYVSHEKLKEMTKACKAVIRTGETTPYANIILQSGCIF